MPVLVLQGVRLQDHPTALPECKELEFIAAESAQTQPGYRQPLSKAAFPPTSDILLIPGK